MTHRRQLAGALFGRWTALHYVGQSSWMCRCACGTEAAVKTSSLVAGVSRSCGCWKTEQHAARASEKAQKKPIYTLPHGIEVIGEYAPSERNPYWRVRVRPHHFFPDARPHFGAISVHRSRAVLASVLGRPLERNDHAHHIDGDRTNDSPANLQLLRAEEHNRHHKIGARHTAQVKQQIRNSLKQAHADGRHKKPIITTRDSLGRIVTCS